MPKSIFRPLIQLVYIETRDYIKRHLELGCVDRQHTEINILETPQNVYYKHVQE